MSAPSRYVNPAYRGPVQTNPADGESAIVIYGYVPSAALAIVAIVTFALALGGHLWRMIRARDTRAFHALFLTGCVLELVGYGSRLSSHYKPFVVKSFVIQYFFIVVAPIAFQAALYIALSMAVKRLSRQTSKGLLGFDPKWMVVGMIVADIITTLVQVAGAALIGTAESNLYQGKRASVSPEQANNILLAGLSLQTVAFVVFVSLVLICIVRSRRASHPSTRSSPNPDSADFDVDARPLPTRLSTALLSTSFVLLVRTSFRLAESASGTFSQAATTEALFGALEFAPVAIAAGAWVFVPLESVLPTPPRSRPQEDRGEEAETTSSSEAGRVESKAFGEEKNFE